MSGILIVGLCSVCIDDGKAVPLELMAVDPAAYDDEAVACWEWRCPVCRKLHGVHIDTGTVDLGLLP